MLRRCFVFAVLVVAAACGTDDASIPSSNDAGVPGTDGGPPASDGSVPEDDAAADGGADSEAPPVYGLDSRPSNATCKAFTKPPTTGVPEFVDRFPTVPLTTPVGIFQRPGDNTRFYVTERRGRVMYFPNDPNAGDPETHVALDLHTVTFQGADCSMSGIAFPSDFATSKHAYVSYCYKGPQTGDQVQLRVSRFATDDGGTTFDPASEQMIMGLDLTYNSAGETGLHAIDAMRFGTDGFLYVSVGDGGPQGSGGGHHAQDKNDLRGKLLRLDVHDFTKSLSLDYVADRQRTAVDIPTDNPFATAGGRPEIYAYGFRNPWQWHFDRATQKIWLGDVGYGTWEEVDRDVQKGGNYGWGVYEGFNCTGYFAGGCPNPDPTLIPPLLTYHHGSTDQQGNAITGGLVYRGTAVPSLTGAYIFGDSSAGRVWAVKNVDALTTGGAPPAKVLLGSGLNVSSFGEDQDGELYATLLFGPQAGRVMMLREPEAASGGDAGGPPLLLSDTGCFDKANPANPKEALVPFQPTAQLWSDGASKRRWLAMPDDAKITVKADGDFDLPKGSVLVKEFSFGARKVETRFFVRRDADGVWDGYSYQWNDAQTDATLVPSGGATLDLGTQTWKYPTRSDCHRCHTNIAGTTLGLELAQLDADYVYSTTGRTANQVATLDHLGFFAAPLPSTRPAKLARLDDTTQSMEARAKSYLHANCANCHRPDGPTFTPPDFRFSTPLGQMNVCGVHPTIDDLEAYIPANPLLIAPGDSDSSVVYWRMQTTEDGVRMPPLGRTLTHDAAVTVLATWIQGLTTCP